GGIAGVAARFGGLEQLVDIAGGGAQRREPRQRRLDRHARLQRVDGIGELGELAREIRRVRARIANEGAAALLPADAAFGFQAIERLAYGAAADADLVGELALGRQPAGSGNAGIEEVSKPRD